MGERFVCELSAGQTYASVALNTVRLLILSAAQILEVIDSACNLPRIMDELLHVDRVVFVTFVVQMLPKVNPGYGGSAMQGAPAVQRVDLIVAIVGKEFLETGQNIACLVCIKPLRQ